MSDAFESIALEFGKDAARKFREEYADQSRDIQDEFIQSLEKRRYKEFSEMEFDEPVLMSSSGILIDMARDAE